MNYMLLSKFAHSIRDLDHLLFATMEEDIRSTLRSCGIVANETTIHHSSNEMDESSHRQTTGTLYVVVESVDFTYYKSNI